jgi:hypothetical protein
VEFVFALVLTKRYIIAAGVPLGMVLSESGRTVKWLVNIAHEMFQPYDVVGLEVLRFVSADRLG